MPTILIKKSDTPSAVPTGSDLTNLAGGAEIAVNTADKRVFSMNSSSAIIELGTNPQSITVSSGSTLNGGVVINELGADADTRIEGDTDANLFFVDASTDRIGVGTSSPAYKLDVAGNVNGAVTVGVNNSNSGSSGLARFIAIADAGNAAFGMTSSAYTDITGATDAMLLNAGNASGGIAFALEGVLRMKLDSSGNLGLGVTPSAWRSTEKALQIGSAAVFLGRSDTLVANMASNWYVTSGGTNAYIATGNASLYQQLVGEHRWFTAPSGTAGDPITFTQAMTLDASKRLKIGTTTAGVGDDNNTALSIANGGATVYTSQKASGGQEFIIGTDATNGTFIGSYSNDNLIFRTNNNERARITSGGDWQVKTGASAAVIAKGGDTDAEGWNGAQTSLYVGKVNGTGRSINAGGTVNASGTDYAEYMTKAGEFVIAKGDICGIDANGKLTNVFADAVSFVVKSTDPSYVGGDSWGIGLEGEELEAARQKVDRIAFAGQVPVNVLGATPGQYIVPVDDNGAIKGIAVSNPTFEQYQSAVGKVIAIEDDGRARIIVKVA